MKLLARAGLWLVLALGFALRVYGLGYGLPNHEHAQTYDPDEWTPMSALRSMHPRQLDFNPHYFDNPTLVYYLYGAAFQAAAATGWIHVVPSERYYYEHPESVARMVLLGRLISLLAGTLTPWLVYLLARRWRLSRGWALFAGLLAALQASLVLHSHFMTVNALAALATLLALLALERWQRHGTVAAASLAGAGVGFALSVKYTGAILAVAVLITAWMRARNGAAGRAALQAALVLLVAVGLLCVTSPYLLLASGEAIGRLATTARTLRSTESTPWLATAALVLRVFLRTVTWSCTPGLALALGFGVVAALWRRRGAAGVPVPAAAVAAAWAIAFSFVALRSGPLLTDSRLTPLFAVGCVFAAFGLARLARTHRTSASVLAAAVAALALPWAVLVAARFTDPAPQVVASRWLRTHTRGDETMWVAGTGLYFAPDLVQREFQQARHAEDYARLTGWRFFPQNEVAGTPFAEALALQPELVVLTQWLPIYRAEDEWLSAPGYRLVAYFPGRMHLGERRLAVPLDAYDVDVWVLARKDAAGPR